ncbi:MAG: prolipoprotein diacylglyceryl transferase [candidate division WOR-3 bacterium]
MHRIIFHFGNITLYSYGLMQAIGFLASLLVIFQLSKKSKISKDVLFDLSVWVIIGGIIGARIWFVVENFNIYKDEILSIIKIWEGGMVFYGGFFGGVIAGLIYIKRNHLDLLKVGDIFMTSFPLGIFFGRIGCFLNGCCYGKISETFGLRFPRENFPPPYQEQLEKGLIKPDVCCSLPVIPTQLVESFTMLIVFFILYYLYNRKKFFDGFIFYSFFIIYGIERFLVDFLREYSKNALVFKFFSLSQITSLLIILFSSILLFTTYKKSKKV